MEAHVIAMCLASLKELRHLYFNRVTTKDEDDWIVMQTADYVIAEMEKFYGCIPGESSETLILGRQHGGGDTLPQEALNLDSRTTSLDKKTPLA